MDLVSASSTLRHDAPPDLDLVVATSTLRHDAPPDLEQQDFLPVPGCRSPSLYSQDEVIGFEALKTQYSCYEYIQIKTHNCLR
jgi:hypothetical protein